MKRDFSEASKQELLNLVSQVEGEKWSDFTDWFGDRWYDFESWIGKLNIKNYVNNINEYHKKVIDKNNTSKETIEKIFADVSKVDVIYGKMFALSFDSLEVIKKYIDELSNIVLPSNGDFIISKKINVSWKSVINDLANRMLYYMNGIMVFDEKLISEYFKKDVNELTPEEKVVLVEVIMEAEYRANGVINDALRIQEINQIDESVFKFTEWIEDNKAYKGFAAGAEHYNEIYVNLLNCISEEVNNIPEENENYKSFAQALVKVINGEEKLILEGKDYSNEILELFGGLEFKEYVAQYISKHTTEFFKSMESVIDWSYLSSLPVYETKQINEIYGGD